MSASTSSIRTSTGQIVDLPSNASFTQFVNDALRNYHSTLALSRSVLANSELVTPLLVRDEASPTAEERGQGLRLLLQWAVTQLAPGPLSHPLGDYRPLDDPTWRDPRWWRYNILRHRYLEPLHPDDFVGDGRYTESLVALTGISSNDTFFDERARAIREVADRLRQQVKDGQANADLQRLALQQAILPLEREAEAARLLGMAATFDDIFPRSLLLEMAAQEITGNPTVALDLLTDQRLLLTGDEGAHLWLSPVLRAYVYARQSKEDRQRRHRSAAAHYEAQGAALPAALHWQRANLDARSVRVLLPAVDELVRELQVKELIELLRSLDLRRLEPDQRYAMQLLLSDLFQQSGQHEDALAACRQALRASDDPGDQARVYRRLGKLYESRNQLHALRYYQQAVERFQPADPELAELLKDRGWIYFYRQEWGKAARDLQQALQTVPESAQQLQADIYDAMASLVRETGDRDRAVAHAERALAIREEVGDLLRIAKSHGNLGLLYRNMGEFGHAITAYREAMTTYQKIGNQELMAVALLNIGAAHFLDRNIDAAIVTYQQSLAICAAIGLPLIEIKSHYNLAEAFAGANQPTAAAQHWQAGYQLCRQYDFDDQAMDFLELSKTIAVSFDAEAIVPSRHEASPSASVSVHLSDDEKAVLALARSEQSLTPKQLMHAANISRATATRRLTALVEKGVLHRQGEGPATSYVSVERAPAGAAHVTSVSPDVSPGLSPLEETLTTLRLHQQDLRHSYAVDALAVVGPPAPLPHLRMLVRFTQLPDLAGYLALKQHLREVLQVEIDLLPEPPTRRASAELGLPGVHWVWA